MGTMAQIIHYPQKTHILIVEDDWVIREVLKKHFLDQPNCRLSFFSDLGQALYFLRLDCNAQLILSNINLSATGGINLSARICGKINAKSSFHPATTQRRIASKPLMPVANSTAFTRCGLTRSAA